MTRPARGRWLLRLLVSGACVWPNPAPAQISPNRVAPPERTDQTVRPGPRGAEPAQPDTAGDTRQPLIAPFVLRSVMIEGASLPRAELDAAWAPFRGRTFAAADLVRLTDAIAAVYERHDLALYTVLVEDQDFRGGEVRVRVLEGHIESTEIVGATDGRLRADLETRLRRLADERPLRRSTLEREISLLRDMPGLQADVALANGADPDGVGLILTVRPKRVQGAFAINNRGTALLGRTQVAGDLFLNGLLRPGDQTRITVAAPTDGDLFRSYSLLHTQLLGTEGLSATASVSELRTRPKGTDLRGRARSAGLQVSYPLIRSYARDLYATVGIDGVDNRDAFLGFTFANDRSRAVRASLSYGEQSPRHTWSASAAVSQGLDGLGARVTDRGVSEPDFRKLNVRAGVNVALGAETALRLSAAAQATGDRLPATELFALGGDEFGRGLPASIIAGDRGLAGSAEVAYAPAALPALVRGSEAYAFVDAGKVWYLSRLGFPRSGAQLASAGAGVRAKLSERLILQLEAARSLDNPAEGFADGGWRGIIAIRTIF